ncbi:DUF3180 domain-containing protein [Gulosibacter massiliensis]|uniref:DUF3180 domain-containing protein n=1 Tax=Gulosibacter massiliensis TaxID=2479839 RepID=UPI000F644555|nr:DUF3180 domain-containing protein [Gulosibacter massiliensis]
MTRTNPWHLVLLFVAAGVVVWALQVWLTSGGSATIVPSLPFGITLLLIGIVTIVLAWPVRRYTQALRKAQDSTDRRRDDVEDDRPEWREVSRKRVDPQRAMLALALAKASSLGGSIFAGGCLATVLWLASRTVVGAGMPLAIVSLVCAVALLVAGLVAENWCALPPDDSEPAGDSVPSAG